jgi:hypothetical protein
VRTANIDRMRALGLPLPPTEHPLVWESGDTVELRPTAEMEARLAILHLLLARCFGMPPRGGMGWLLSSHLVEQVTPPEWEFVTGQAGDHRSFVLHHEAIFALTWLLGMTRQLDPTVPSDERLVELLPNIAAGETFAAWRSRTLAAPRDPAQAAVQLDYHYCLDWGYLEAEKTGAPLPGLIDADAIGQRRWALEWAVVFRGPYHDPPAGWEEVDLSV